MGKKVIVVNFVAKHSYIFVKRMIEGLSHNNCYIFAIVSKNMKGLEEWKELDNIEFYEVDGYTDTITFGIKLIKFYFTDTKMIRKRVRELKAVSMYIPICTYWSWFINQILLDLPLIYAMHDPIAHGSRISLIRLFNYFLGKKAKTIIILSETFREYVKKVYKKLDNQIITIPSGHESLEETINKVELIHYDNSKVNFLFHGRIDKYKGLHILAEAYEKLHNKYDDVTLTIAGSGDFKEYQVAFDRLQDCRIINRWLTDEEIKGLFNDKSVITVLPYISATQSGVINVAMPNGSPIIATRCGGIIEQIDDNKTGYLIEPNNVNELYEKMEYVLNHRDELDTIRNNAYARMKTLEWDVLAARVVEIL